MSRKTLFYIALNAAIAVLGCLSLRNVAKYTPDRKVRPNPIEVRRKIGKAMLEGRVETIRVYYKNGVPVRRVVIKPKGQAPAMP